MGAREAFAPRLPVSHRRTRTYTSPSRPTVPAADRPQGSAASSGALWTHAGGHHRPSGVVLGVTAIRTPGPAPAHCQALPGLPCQLLGASRTPSLLAVLTERDLSRGEPQTHIKLGALGVQVCGVNPRPALTGDKSTCPSEDV